MTMTISNKKEQQYISLIKKNKLKFKDIPEEEQTYQMCLEAIKRKSSDLQFIKDEFKTDELFLEGFKNDHILWLNIKNPSEEFTQDKGEVAAAFMRAEESPFLFYIKKHRFSFEVNV